MSNQATEMKFNELSNNMNIKLINGSRLQIFLIKKYIYILIVEKNTIIKPVDFSIKNKEIHFRSELLFGILSFNSYLDIESMKIVSSSVEINVYKLLSIRSPDFMYAIAKLKILDYLGFHKYLEQTGYDFGNLEFIDIYNEIEVYIATKNYKNNVKQLKEWKKLELLREQKIKQIKNETKTKLNLLNYDTNDILKDLDFDLKRASLKNRFSKRQNSYESEIKLRLQVKEKINEIKRLKEEVMWINY